MPFCTAQFVGLAIIVGRDYENSDAYRAAAVPFLVGVHASGILTATAIVNTRHLRYHVPVTFPTIMDLGARVQVESCYTLGRTITVRRSRAVAGGIKAVVLSPPRSLIYYTIPVSSGAD